VSPVALAVIKASVAPPRQARAMGVWAALGGLAVALGPILGGVLLQRFWWGSVFLINVPVSVICAVLLLRLAGESRSPAPFRLDLPGLLLSTAAVAAVLYGVIRAGDDNDWAAPGSAGMICLGVVLASLLVVVELRATHPVLDVRLFRDGAFSGGAVAMVLAFLGINGALYLLVFFLQLVLGHPPLQVGLLLLPAAVGSVAGAIASAGVMRRYEPRSTISAGLAVLGTSLIAFTVATAGTPLWVLEAAQLLTGAGMGVVMTTATTVAMSAARLAKAGVDGAIPNIMRQFGSALGIAVLGTVLSIAYRGGTAGILAALPPGMRAELQAW
jgi:MFS family permease